MALCCLGFRVASPSCSDRAVRADPGGDEHDTRTRPSVRYPARVLLTVATAFFAANCALGLAAQFATLHLGWLHHAAYALVFASALACLVFAFHPALVVVVLALAAFPRARPRTWQHPALAATGAIGYVAAWTW